MLPLSILYSPVILNSEIRHEEGCHIIKIKRLKNNLLQTVTIEEEKIFQCDFLLSSKIYI
jgi:hypothetical protein